MNIGFVLPHIFMHKEIFPHVIFAPGQIAIDYVIELAKRGHKVFFFTPKYDLKVPGVINIHSDTSEFEKELKLLNTTYTDLLKNKPLTFITLARQLQTELIANAYTYANGGKIDVLHFFANEEEIAMAFASFSKSPTFFTHHEPFNLLSKYRSQFEKYRHLNWISLSYSQRLTAPKDMNWIGNVYNGMPKDRYIYYENPKREYYAYMGRIIKNKGVHLAVKVAKELNLELRIAGKYYDGYGKEKYFDKYINPKLNEKIKYVGHLRSVEEKQTFLSHAKALIIPSLWEEPFGMVAIEALACGTPVICSDRGALKEIIRDGINGLVINTKTEDTFMRDFKRRFNKIEKIDRNICRKSFEDNFILEMSTEELVRLYRIFIKNVRKL